MTLLRKAKNEMAKVRTEATINQRLHTLLSGGSPLASRHPVIRKSVGIPRGADLVNAYKLTYPAAFTGIAELRGTIRRNLYVGQDLDPACALVDSARVRCLLLAVFVFARLIRPADLFHERLFELEPPWQVAGSGYVQAWPFQSSSNPTLGAGPRALSGLAQLCW